MTIGANLSLFETGDTVKHIPTGENWRVAFCEGDRLWWCGWPEGCADVNDCILVQKCPYLEEKQALLDAMSKMEPGDARGQYARRILNVGKGES